MKLEIFITWTALAILIANLIFYGMGLINIYIFWAVIGFCAIIAYLFLPRIKSK